MRQLRMSDYQPLFPAPERAVLTLLHAALHVTEYAIFQGSVICDLRRRELHDSCLRKFDGLAAEDSLHF